MTQLTYTGRRLSGAKLVYTYIRRDGGKGDAVHDPYLLFRRTLKAGAKIGAILEAEEPEPGKFMRDAKILGYTDTSAVIVNQWEAHDRADAGIYHRRQEEKELNRKHKTPLEMEVQRLRMAMSGMSRPQRAAFIGWLIEELS